VKKRGNWRGGVGGIGKHRLGLLGSLEEWEEGRHGHDGFQWMKKRVEKTMPTGGVRRSVGKKKNKIK
jgi:hypothetical protein